MFSLEHASYFVPNTFLSVMEDCEKLYITQAEAKIFSRIYGIKKLPIAINHTVVELLLFSVRKLLLESKVKKHNIRVLIHAHTAKVINHFADVSVGEKIKKLLNLSNAISFSMTINNCASLLDAMELAAFFLKNFGNDAKAIVIAGEKAFTKSVQVIPNTSITGDASSACLISLNTQKNCLINLHCKIYGQYSAGIWMKESDAKDFEKNYVLLLGKAINDAILKAKINLSSIKLIIPHNVNLISWKRLADHLHLDRKIIYLDNVEKYGHCFGSDLLINYTDIVEKKLLNSGDYYLMATVGLGATFSVAVFQY